MAELGEWAGSSEPESLARLSEGFCPACEPPVSLEPLPARIHVVPGVTAGHCPTCSWNFAMVPGSKSLSSVVTQPERKLRS